MHSAGFNRRRNQSPADMAAASDPAREPLRALVKLLAKQAATELFQIQEATHADPQA